MDSLQMVRKQGSHKLKGLAWTNLHTLGPPLPIFFAQVADHSEIVARGIKARNIGRAGFPTLPASRTQATILINGHVANFLVVMDNGRIYWTRLLALPLLFRTL
jgi:hypothetical protein